MMYPRLLLLKQFLREDGAIFVSIDDNEVATLRLLMDEIFGAGNFIANLVWQKKYAVKSDSGFFSESHDHIIIYARIKIKLKVNGLARTIEHDARYNNPDNDRRGIWTSGPLQRNELREYAVYPIIAPTGKEHFPPQGTSWRFTKDKMAELIADGRIWFGASGNNVPRLKRFLSDVSDSIMPTTWWDYGQCGHNDEARRENKDIFSERQLLFATPKPTRMIQRILQIATDKDSLILDSFAGSGTTAHAVLKQNAEDGGNRKFILVEMDANIARNVTAERVKRVAQGYSKGSARSSTSSDRTEMESQKAVRPELVEGPIPNNAEGPVLSQAEGQKWVAGLGGGFQFCTLSPEPLFNAQGQIRSDVTFAELAEFVWFSETGAALPQKATASPLIGIHEGKAVYLLFNGILKDRGDLGGNVLNSRTLAVLPAHEGPRVVYGARSRFDKAKLARMGIEFKQLPYDLTGKSWV